MILAWSKPDELRVAKRGEREPWNHREEGTLYEYDAAFVSQITSAYDIDHPEHHERGKSNRIHVRYEGISVLGVAMREASHDEAAGDDADESIDRMDMSCARRIGCSS